MYLLGASTWNTPTDTGAVTMQMQVYIASVKAKDVQLLLDIIACFQCLLVGSQGRCSWQLAARKTCGL